MAGHAQGPAADLIARDKAREALDGVKDVAHGVALVKQQLGDHVDNCGERNEESRRRYETLTTEMKAGFDKQSQGSARIHGRIDRLLWATITGMGGIILAAGGVIATLVLR